ncbi:MAG: ABC transporter substrate-binding protein [Bacteroidia bacterium]|nr:ABC transporter substrate-binding protein [Bacteroidia bacterium]
MDNAVHDRVFYFNIDEGLSTLDPAFARARANIWTTTQLFNGLLSLDSALVLRPAIAHRWEISPDGRTYRFFLRQDVYFHRHPAFGPDSTRRVTARDFVYSFTRICDPATGSTGQWIFNGKITGLKAFTDGQATTITGFEAVNDSVLQIHLDAPFPPFLGLLAMPYGFVVPEEAVRWYGDDFSAHPVGTGPFQFFRWTDGQRLIFHRNPHYFETRGDRRLPYLDAVSISFIPSRLSAFIAFLQGKLDFIGDLDNAYRDEILRPDGSIQPEMARQYQIQLAPQLNTEYLGILTDPDLPITQGHPLADLRVRQALNLAIDRERLVRYLLYGMGYPASAGIIPYGMPGYSPGAVAGYGFDPGRARTLLADAGFPGGRGLPELTLYTTPKYAALSEYVQKSLENIGIRLRIQSLQGGALRKEVYNGNALFWRASWIADYPDGENYLSLFYSPNMAPAGPNTTHFSSPAFDQLYRQALTETRDSLRYVLYHRMERLVLASAPVIPLYYDRSFRILQPGVHGLRGNPMNHLFLKEVYKTPNP